MKSINVVLIGTMLVPAVALAQVSGSMPMREEHRGAAYVSPENIRETERVLQAQGFDPGRIDGLMDQSLVDALRAFQQREGLLMTGVLNPSTVRRLASRGAAYSAGLNGGRPPSTSGGAQR